MSDLSTDMLTSSTFSRFLDEDGLHTLETRIDEVFARKGEAGGAGPRYVYTENPVTEAHYEGEKLWNNDHFYTLIDDIESGTTITTEGVGKNAEEDTIPDGVYASVIGAPGSGGGGGASSADDVSYDNTDSGLTADNVQDAIDEVNAKVEGLDASDIAFDNTDTGMTADDVQEAIGELNSKTSYSTADVDYTPTGTLKVTQVLDNLFALIDTSKLTPNSKLFTGIQVFSITYLTSSRVQFAQLGCSSSNNDLLMIDMKASGSREVNSSYKSNNTITYTDMSNDTSSWTNLKIYY